jgi:hypothetical protein
VEIFQDLRILSVGDAVLISDTLPVWLDHLAVLEHREHEFERWVSDAGGGGTNSGFRSGFGRHDCGLEESSSCCVPKEGLGRV